MSESNSKVNISTVREWVSQSALIFLCLTFASYFLVTTRQGSAIPSYFLALIGLFGFFLGVKNNLQALTRSPTFLSFVALMFYVLLSMSWLDAPDYSEAVQAVSIDILLLVFSAVACALIRTDIDVSSSVMRSVLAGATISGSLILLIDIAGLNLDYTGAWNVWNVASIAFGFVLVVAIGNALRFKADFAGIIYSLVGLVCLAVILLLGSSSVLFALLLSLTAIAFAALWESRFRSRSLYWLVVCVFLMFLVLQVFGVLVQEQRSEIWTSTLDEVFEKGLIFGLGYSEVIVPKVSCELLSLQNSDCDFQHPHNLFVSTIYQMGLAGLIVLLTLYLVAISSLFERKSGQRWVLGGCLFYSGAIFMFDGQQLVANMDFVWLIFWLPVFLVIREEFVIEPI